MNLGTNDLQILMADSPSEAPVYREPEYRAANLTTAHVVGRGTVNGNPTVDFVFVDAGGQKYVAMLTGSLVETLVGAIRGMRERTAGRGREQGH